MFTNEQYYQRFIDWVAAQGPEQARQVMEAYIEENFEHFMQFVENYRTFHP